MLAYKYRSPSQIVFALDIVLNGRLFCADWKEMNDHREGEFWAEPDAIKVVENAKEQYRVCSLSIDKKNYLLWVHYADDFRGLSIEVELPDNSSYIKKVEYYSGYFKLTDLKCKIDKRAEEILSSKYVSWKYEKEVRVICTNSYFNVLVKSLIAGYRMDDVDLNILRIICENKGIPIYKAYINEQGVNIVK